MKEQPYFKGKALWAIILGGSSGLGLATARKLAQEGVNLCLIHRDRRQTLVSFEKALEDIKGYDIKCLTFNLDATKSTTREEVFEGLKSVWTPQSRVGVLLHAISRGNLKTLNPQSNSSSNFEVATNDPETRALYEALENRLRSNQTYSSQSITHQDFVITIDAMALSLYDWLQEIVQRELQADQMRVIGLTSEGSQKSIRGYGGVSVAKAALEALCRSIALEFANRGVRCNVVQAGVTDTPSLRMIPGSDYLKSNAVFRNPFHRLTQPEDVANAIYLLCRREADWINGAIIPVDGGERIT